MAERNSASARKPRPRSGRPASEGKKQKKNGAIDGARTRDIQDHNLALYQLSYDRHTKAPGAVRPGARFTAGGPGTSTAGLR